MEILLAIFWTASAMMTIWCCLVCVELKHKTQVLDYALNVSAYNDIVIKMNEAQEISAEDEYNLAVFQEELVRQAREIGMEFKPLQRLKGRQGPD